MHDLKLTMHRFSTNAGIDNTEPQSLPLNQDHKEEKHEESEISGTKVSHAKQEPIVVTKVLSLAFEEGSK
jgi:hypothetical protein